MTPKETAELNQFLTDLPAFLKLKEKVSALSGYVKGLEDLLDAGLVIDEGVETVTGVLKQATEDLNIAQTLLEAQVNERIGQQTAKESESLLDWIDKK